MTTEKAIVSVKIYQKKFHLTFIPMFDIIYLSMLDKGGYNMYYVYRFLKDGDVVYVGQTRDFHRRIQSHLRRGVIKEWDSIEYIIADSINQMANLEGFFINKFSPIYNVVMPLFDASQINENSIKWKVCNDLDRYKEYFLKQLPLHEKRAKRLEAGRNNKEVIPILQAIYTDMPLTDFKILSSLISKTQKSDDRLFYLSLDYKEFCFIAGIDYQNNLSLDRIKEIIKNISNCVRWDYGSVVKLCSTLYEVTINPGNEKINFSFYTDVKDCFESNKIYRCEDADEEHKKYSNYKWLGRIKF